MNFCPHCSSGNDPVLKDTTWSCGVRFNDAQWRTKECYKRQLHIDNEHLRLQEQHLSEFENENKRLKQRITRLEELEKLGDYMRSHSNNEWWCENWDKAKEAKP